MPQRIEISPKTIIFTVFFLILLAFLYFIRPLILELFVALLIMTALNPLVNFLAQFKMPRTLAVLIVYVVLIGGLILLIANIAPPLVEQSSTFVNGIPVYINSLNLGTQLGDKGLEEFLSLVGVLPAHFAQFALSIFSNIFEVVTVLIFAFYMLVNRDRLNYQVAYFFDHTKHDKIVKALGHIEKRLGDWTRGQLTLMFGVGLLTYIGLRLLGVPFALPLSIIAGVLEMVPMIGPVIAAIPAVLIGFSISPVMGFSTAGLAFLIQQVENYFFVPVIMQKSLGISSLVVLLALAIGFRLANVIGAVIAVPAVLAIDVIFKEFNFSLKKLV